ncbi:hypothetical protein [Kangiella marina]|uniref:Uncharacterized protein n=1 Tax=Kangiella marina TaxID=1079178 RepID=A0ABP8IJX5_9GAMM
MKQDIYKMIEEMDEYFYGIMEIDPLSVLSSVDEISQLNEVAKKYKCASIGDSWREISEEDGFDLIKDGIAFDLVFTSYRNVDEKLNGVRVQL